MNVHDLKKLLHELTDLPLELLNAADIRKYANTFAKFRDQLQKTSLLVELRNLDLEVPHGERALYETLMKAKKIKKPAKTAPSRNSQKRGAARQDSKVPRRGGPFDPRRSGRRGPQTPQSACESHEADRAWSGALFHHNLEEKSPGLAGRTPFQQNRPGAVRMSVKITMKGLILKVLGEQLRPVTETELLERVRFKLPGKLPEDIAASFDKGFQSLLKDGEISTVDEGSLRKFQVKTDMGEERLYAPLVEWLEGEGVHARILDARRAERTKKGGNRWRFPDIVGVRQVIASPTVRYIVEKTGGGTVELHSFEVKLRLSRSNMRDAFYQCLANSAWANRKYLVASEVDQGVSAELERLSAVHGIGLIRLSVSVEGQLRPGTEKLIESPHRELDAATVEELHKQWAEFREWIDALNRL